GSHPRKRRIRAGGPRRGRRARVGPAPVGRPSAPPSSRARPHARGGSRSGAAGRRGAARRKSALGRAFGNRTAREFVADRAYAGNRRASHGRGEALALPSLQASESDKTRPVLPISTRKKALCVTGEKPVETVECPRKRA